NSAAVHTLGVVLEDAAATPLPRYATDHLFGALGVDTVAWEPLDRGTVNGGSVIALRPRDLLKFGQLFLQRGWSGDASVVPESWVDSVTRPHFSWRTVVGPLQRVTYGMLWWVSDIDPAAYFAWGYGGQVVYVVPDRDLVVVATTDWGAAHRNHTHGARSPSARRDRQRRRAGGAVNLETQRHSGVASAQPNVVGDVESPSPRRPTTAPMPLASPKASSS
ncbi:MAG TPA: serine hydrolase, partial [Acidimicrobiales bacterium]